MRTKTIVLAMMLSLGANAFAQGGTKMRNNPADDVITCKDKVTKATLLRFASGEAHAQASNEAYDLTASMKGDDLGEVALFDKRTQDTVTVRRFDNIVQVTLASKDSEEPLVVGQTTRMGYAKVELTHPTTKDNVVVKSSNNWWQNKMEIVFQSEQYPNLPLEVVCEIDR